MTRRNSSYTARFDANFGLDSRCGLRASVYHIVMFIVILPRIHGARPTQIEQRSNRSDVSAGL